MRDQAPLRWTKNTLPRLIRIFAEATVKEEYVGIE